ncbi:MAG: hypothetical protein HYX92_07370 [Chloroflexi bacterium]|nr:hypothetical protein [Chloroflexota bacterium]
MEQKNWTVVRQVVGYKRYSSRPALDCMNRIYLLLRLYVNFFHPMMNPELGSGKTRDGAKVRKVYDQARTPYRRLLDAGALTEAKRQELAATCDQLNPVLLLKQIESNVDRLDVLSEGPAPAAPPKSSERSPEVSLYMTQ